LVCLDGCAKDEKIVFIRSFIQVQTSTQGGSRSKAPGLSVIRLQGGPALSEEGVAIDSWHYI